jgi:hypothetical protein
MIMRLLNELYRGEHASIPVDGSPEQAALPIFRGRFIVVRGRTYLTGTFALRRAAQAFMTAWFCFRTACSHSLAAAAQREP